MEIKVFEFKKIIKSPVVIVLTVVFLSFNLMTILSSKNLRSELKVLNKIVDKVGYEINDKMLADFEKYYNEQLKKVNEITSKKTTNTYSSAYEVLNDYKKVDSYSKEELALLNEVRVTENYYNLAKSMDKNYENINIKKLGESEIAMCKLSGTAADTMRTQYDKLDIRFDKLKENGEHKNLFFIGKAYRMHTLLFNSLLRNCIFEIMILVVLITAYLINYEFENSTCCVVYSTKRGRDLNWDKLHVSIFVSVLLTTIIIGVSLLIYFIVFDYSGLWKVPISNGFNWESEVPYISWWNMSFLKYLLCSIGLIYICEIIYTVITYIISTFVRNSYLVFFIFAIIFGMALVLPGFVPTNNNAVFIGAFTPFALIMNSFIWFMEKGAFSPFKYYELITVSLWLVFIMLLVGICTRRFKKQNI